MAQRPTVPTTLGAMCLGCHEAGHIARDCFRTVMTCYGCRGLGHRTVSCPHEQRAAPVRLTITLRMSVPPQVSATLTQMRTHVGGYHNPFEPRWVITEYRRTESEYLGYGESGHQYSSYPCRPGGIAVPSVMVPQFSLLPNGPTQGRGAIPMVRGLAPKGFTPRGRP